MSDMDPPVMLPISLERNFAKLMGAELGKRGEAWDADVWRVGNVRDIGNVFLLGGQELNNRVARLGFSEQQSQTGGPHIRLKLAADRLAQRGKTMMQEPRERKITLDFHWVLIEGLLSSTVSLLEYAEEQQ